MTEPLAEGLHDIPPEAYHADPAPEPSLSSSIAKLLINRSPRHAFLAQPRLNPDYEPERKQIFDIGSAAHACMLNSDEAYRIIDADSYRTKAAQLARDKAYEEGVIPLLPQQFEHVQAIVRAGRAQLARHRDAADAFLAGDPERTLIWKEGTGDDAVWCRCRLDWLPDQGTVFHDFKSTTDASPDVWQRRCFDLGADIQAAFYLRGIKAVLGIPHAEFRFVVQEVEPPYALSVIALMPSALKMADSKVAAAIELWRRCLKSNTWPGYASRTAFIDAPPWTEKRWLEAESRAELARQDGEDLFQTMIDWQSPLEAAE